MIVTSQWGSYKTRSTQAFPAFWTHFKFVGGWHDNDDHDMIIMTWWQSNDDDDVEDLDPGVFLQIWAQPPFSSKHSSTSSHFDLSTSLEFFQWELFRCLWMENYMDWLRIDLNPLLQAQWWPPGWFIHSCSHPPFAWSSSWFNSFGMMIMGWL